MIARKITPRSDSIPLSRLKPNVLYQTKYRIKEFLYNDFWYAWLNNGVLNVMSLERKTHCSILMSQDLKILCKYKFEIINKNNITDCNGNIIYI